MTVLVPQAATQEEVRHGEHATEKAQSLSKSALKRMRKKRAHLKAGMDLKRTPTSPSPAMTNSTNENRRTKGPLVTARASTAGRGAKGGKAIRGVAPRASPVAAPPTPGSSTKGNASLGLGKAARRQKGASQDANIKDTDTRTRKHKKKSGEVSDRLDELVAQYQAKLFGRDGAF